MLWWPIIFTNSIDKVGDETIPFNQFKDCEVADKQRNFVLLYYSN